MPNDSGKTKQRLAQRKAATFGYEPIRSIWWKQTRDLPLFTFFTIRDMLRAFSRSPDIDRRIVDRTGLTETFDIDFVWTPDRSGPGAAPPADVVSIFTALQEQLGLKLESRREPADVVVIESVERPTPN